MKLDAWQRLQVRFMWAVLTTLLRVHRGDFELRDDVLQVELGLHKLMNQL